MSNNFDNLSTKEQAILHERMAEWASLSPQQRAQARLNFNQTKTLDADAKKTQWETYQALSPDEFEAEAGAAEDPAGGLAALA